MTFIFVKMIFDVLVFNAIEEVFTIDNSVKYRDTTVTVGIPLLAQKQ